MGVGGGQLKWSLPLPSGNAITHNMALQKPASGILENMIINSLNMKTREKDTDDTTHLHLDDTHPPPP